MVKYSYMLALLLVSLPASIQAGVKLYDLDSFVKACLASSDKLSRPICECTAQKAAKRLSPTGFEFLIATLRKDKEGSLALRHKLERSELSTAGAFMSTGPAECADELNSSRKE